MLRAVVLSARLEFTIDEPILDAIKVHRHEIARSAPARLLEEFYKILRSGHAEDAMRQLRATGLMKEITPELAAASEGVWRSIAALDRYRARLRVRAGVADQRDPRRHAAPSDGADHGVNASRPIRSNAKSSWGCCRSPGAMSNGCSRSSPSSRSFSTSPHPVRAQRALLHRADPRRSVDLARDPRRQARSRGALARAQGAGRVAPATADARRSPGETPFSRRRRRAGAAAATTARGRDRAG